MNDHSDDAPLLPGLKPVLELLASEPQRVDLVFCKKGLHGPEAREVQNLWTAFAGARARGATPWPTRGW